MANVAKKFPSGINLVDNFITPSEVAKENVSLVTRGNATWNSDNLTLSKDCYLNVPPLSNDKHTIQAQAINILNNQCAYVDIDRNASTTTNLSVTVDDLSNFTADENKVIIAKREDILLSETVTDEHLLVTTSAAVGQSSDTLRKSGQEFVAGTSGPVSKVRLRLFRDAGLTGTFDLAIQADSSGEPSDVDLDVITVAVSGLPTSAPGAFQDYEMNLAANVVASSSYWIVIRSTGLTGTGNLNVEYDGGTTNPDQFKISQTGGPWQSNVPVVDLTYQVLIGNLEKNVYFGVGNTKTIADGDTVNLEETTGSIKNKIQTKLLTADVTSDGTISDLTFNNLVVGKWYEISGKASLQLDDGVADSSVIFEAIHNGGSIDSMVYTINETVDTGTDQSNFAIHTKFQATATTLTFSATGASANSKITGANNRAETYIQLEERNDLESTTDFT